MSEVELVSDFRKKDEGWIVREEISDKEELWNIVVNDMLSNVKYKSGKSSRRKLRGRTLYKILSREMPWIRTEDESTPEFECFRMSSMKHTPILLPFPNDLTSLLEDFFRNSGQLIVREYELIHKSISKGMVEAEILDRLDKVQLLFGLLKMAYAKRTLNYEVFSEIQYDLIDIKSKLEKDDIDGAQSLSTELSEDFQLMTKTLKELREAGLEISSVEDTGKTIGGMRVFSVKS
jgi:hypothetical protein